MNPEERLLLERTLKLSEENNEMLRKMRRTARFAILWGIIKIFVIAVPFIVGYLYLEPHFGSIGDTFQNARDLLEMFR